MSVLYYLFIDKIGYFHLGRFVDLFQRDLLILLLAVLVVLKIKWWIKMRGR